MRALATTLVSAAAALAVACSPYSPNLPEQPFLCGSGSACPDGFTCTATGSAMVCIDSTPSTTDAGSGSNLGCTPTDNMLEPNDTLGNAYMTPVAATRASIDLADLSICPATDIDNYEFTITQEQQNASATVIYGASGSPLQMSIVEMGAGSNVSLQNAHGMGSDTIVATISNLPVGTYFVQVFGPAAGGTNTYELKLAVTGP